GGAGRLPAHPRLSRLVPPRRRGGAPESGSVRGVGGIADHRAQSPAAEPAGWGARGVRAPGPAAAVAGAPVAAGPGLAVAAVVGVDDLGGTDADARRVALDSPLGALPGAASPGAPAG